MRSVCRSGRHLFLDAAFGLIIVFTCGVPVQADDPKTILFYGNSFTIGSGSTEAESFGGVPAVVRALAVAAGHPAPNVENAAVGGQTLGYHLTNNTAVISNPLDFTPSPGFQWDHVVLQGYSTRPTHIGDLVQFRADALGLYARVRMHSPGVTPILYETWARKEGHSVYAGSPPSFINPAAMQQELRDGYEQARQDIDLYYAPGLAIIAPVGDAWERTGFDDLHASDLYHANSRGTYLDGLVIFGTIYNQSVVGLPKIFTSLTDQEAAELQYHADQVIPRPCGHPGPDCNSNCVPDGREGDCDANGVPDDCDLLAGADDCNANNGLDVCDTAAITVFADDFDNDTSAGWIVIGRDASDVARFHYDYAARSIPPAPHSNGTTRGLMIEANTTAGPAIPSGISAYPVGQFFAGDFVLTWDMYLSWQAPDTTEHMCVGINHSGVKRNGTATVSNDTDGVFFAASGDGGMTLGHYPTDGTIKDFNSYYGNDGDVPTRNVVPHWDNDQLFHRDLFPSVTGDPIGASTAGAAGRQWVSGEISQIDGVVTWKLNGVVIARKPNTSMYQSGNIMLGYFDPFPVQNTTGNNFIVYDNVRVQLLTQRTGRFAACLTGPCLNPPCDPIAYDAVCCAVDRDGDGDIDLLDFAAAQSAYEPPTPVLSFDPAQLAFALTVGEADQRSATVSADNGAIVSVDLTAIDPATQAAPTWLNIPATATTGTAFTVGVDATGLSPGAHAAAITAEAAGYVAADLVVSLNVGLPPADGVILLDFGGSGLTTTGDFRYWNNLHEGSMHNVIALNTVDGQPSGVTAEFPSGFRLNGANLNGPTSASAGSALAALGYPATAMQDSFFGNDVYFSAGIFPVAQLTLSGLNPAATYDLTFFAGRLGVSDTRTTEYAVAGATSQAVTLDVSNNIANVVKVSGIAPDAGNRIVVTIQKAASNNNSYGFYYLGTLELEPHLP